MTLLLEIGADCLVYGLLNEQTKTFLLIKYISIDEFERDERLPQILEELKEFNPLKMMVCSGLPEALLAPLQAKMKDFTALDIIYSLKNPIHFLDSIPEWQLVTLFALPAPLHQAIVSVFPTASFHHAYTPFVKMSNGISDQQLSLHFSTHYFRVLTKKEEKIQLAQTYAYKTPLDVIYFIIKICTELQLNQNDVRIIISGLIEEQSALYEELHHYFLNLQFAENSTYLLPAHPYPDYYFASIYNLAACVS
ncbi:MAG: hypothetical protein NVSMB67_16300 [Flavisolibacter sp.]